jgi:uncharacterized protein (DUF2461 family)
VHSIVRNLSYIFRAYHSKMGVSIGLLEDAGAGKTCAGIPHVADKGLLNAIRGQSWRRCWSAWCAQGSCRS